MLKLRTLALLAAPVAFAMVVSSCDHATAPLADQPSFWGGEGECHARKFTGGGRIDPADGTLTGKMTFGFNIFIDGECNVTKGQFEVVHHPSQTKYHSVSFQNANWYTTTNDRGQTGECFGVDMTMRSKSGNGPWHEHTVGIEGCDFGEPGSSPGTGPDTWWFATTDGSEGDGHGDTGRTELTGGNIQAH